MYQAHFWRHAVLFLTLTAGLPLLCLACGGTKSAVRDADVPVPDTESVLDDSGSAKEQLPKSPDARGLPSEDTDIQLLESVIRQNTAARESIHSLYVDFSWRDDRIIPEMPVPGGTMPSGRQTEEGKSKVWQKEGSYLQDFSRRRYWHDAGVTTDERFIVARGDTYFIEYHELPKILMVFHFENLNSLYEPVATNAVGYPYPDMLDYGYSLVIGTLAEHYSASMSRHPGYSRWTIERVADTSEHLFRVEKTADIQRAPYLDEEILINGDCGFLAAEFRSYGRDGTVLRSMDCGLREIGEGVWFPMTVNRYQTELQSTLLIQVSEVRVNGDIDDATFTLENMDFDPTNVTMTEYAPGGSSKIKKAFWNGQWIPISMIPRPERPDRPDAREVMKQLGAQLERNKQ